MEFEIRVLSLSGTSRAPTSRSEAHAAAFIIVFCLILSYHSQATYLHSLLLYRNSDNDIMMAGLMSYFGGRRDPKKSAREAIVTLRQQLQVIEKKEEYLQRKIEEELKKAKANAVTNKQGR